MGLDAPGGLTGVDATGSLLIDGPELPDTVPAPIRSGSLAYHVVSASLLESLTEAGVEFRKKVKSRSCRASCVPGLILNADAFHGGTCRAHRRVEG